MAVLDNGGHDFNPGRARRNKKESRASQRIVAAPNASREWDLRRRQPAIERSNAFIVVDDESRMRFRPSGKIEATDVRFRALRRRSFAGAIELHLTGMTAFADASPRASSLPSQSRIGDGQDRGSLGQKKQADSV